MFSKSKTATTGGGIHASLLWGVLVLCAVVPGAARGEDAYVETTATEYINTGSMPNPRMRLELDFALKGRPDDQSRLIGTDGDNSNFRFSFYVNGSGNFSFGSGDSFQSQPFNPQIPVDTRRHLAVWDGPGNIALLVTGAKTNSIVLANARTRNGECPLCIGAHNNSIYGTSVNRPAPMKVYGCRIYESGALVRDLRPCRLNGAAGLKDLVTGTFVQCDNGKAVPLASGGDIPEIEDDAYVMSHGDYAMNSRFFMCPDARIELDFGFNEGHTNGQYRVIGADQNSYGTSVAVYTGGNGVSLATGDSFKALYADTPIHADRFRHRAIIDNNRRSTYMTGFTTNWTKNVSAVGDKTAKIPMGIFGDATNADGEQFNNYAPARIYGLKIYKGNGSTLVHDYRPVVQGGVPGLKDQVDGAFITTGHLVAGGRIPSEEGPAYIETTRGNCAIDTGHLFGPTTRVVADFALVSTNNNPQQFIFEANDNRTVTNMIARFYTSGSAVISYACQNLDVNTQWKTTPIRLRPYVRRVGVMDAATHKIIFSTAGFTNVTATAPLQLTKTCTAPTRILAASQLESNFAKVRLYGFQIYEGGTLVRDYVPFVTNNVAGLLDNVTGTFASDDNNNQAFSYGGDITGDGVADDAYLESDGTQAIDTGYLMKVNSKVECDFRLVDAVTTQQRMFGADDDGDFHANTLYAVLYVNGSDKFMWGYGHTFVNTNGPSVVAELKRHRATIDSPNNKLTFTTVGGSTKSKTITGVPHGNTANYPLAVFCNSDADDNGTLTWKNHAQMKLYSFRIYESDALVHEFLPYKSGSRIGLYDTVTGEVKTDVMGSSTPFRIGGAGYDGSGPVLLRTPTSTRVMQGEVAKLEAYAPGATSYRWTLNGHTIPDVTGELDVEWTRGAGEETYTVTPVYDLGGTRVDGATTTFKVNHVRSYVLLIVY